jgi:hypothetical protein
MFEQVLTHKHGRTPAQLGEPQMFLQPQSL